MAVQENKFTGLILKNIFKGGLGSGNFNHSGRPGKHGGSGKVIVGKSEGLNMNKVVVIIPYYEAWVELNEAVKSINEFTPIDVDLCIVDNASREPATFMRGKRKIKIIRNLKNEGFTKAVNQGMKLFRNHDVILFNNDCKATKDWYGPLIKAAYSNKDIGLVCPGHYIGGLKNINNSTINKSTSPKLFMNAEGFRLMEWAGFACVYIKREALKDVGYLNEKYWHYSSDEYWCRDARKKGWQIVYQPKSKVFHDSGVSYSKLKKLDPKTVQDKIDKKFKGN